MCANEYVPYSICHIYTKLVNSFTVFVYFS